MNWKGHIAFGVFFLFIVIILSKFLNLGIPLLSWRFLFLYSPIILFSFLLPDMDHQISKPRLISTLLLLIIIIYFAIMGDIPYIIGFSSLLLIIWVLPLMKGWKHRGHMHSILFILIISLLAISIDFKLAIMVFIGQFSHLIADLEFKLW